MANRSVILKQTAIVFTIMVAVAMLVSAYGGYYNPGRRFGSLFMLAAMAMPVAAAVTLLTALPWLFKRRWLMAAVPLVALLLSWPSLRTVVPLHLFTPSTHNVERDDNTFKILTFNVMNFGPYDPSNHRPNESMKYILESDADVVLLQEGSQERDYMKLSNTKMLTGELAKKYPYRSSRNHDLIILSKYPYEAKTVVGSDANSPVSGRVTSYVVHHPGRDLLLVNAHLRSIGLSENDKDEYARMTRGDVQGKSDLKKMKRGMIDKVVASSVTRYEECETLRRLLDENRDKDVIVAGDFNETPASYCYWTVRGTDMNDAWGDAGFGYYNTFNDRRLLFKIDHILYRGSLSAEAATVDKTGESDHYPFSVVFRLK